MRPPLELSRAVGWAERMATDRSGVSAIEFCLISPMIFFGLLSLVDVGRAINERMALDAALRAGAQIAMSDLGTTAVQSAVTLVDMGRMATDERGTLLLNVERFCACPEDTASSLSCTAICAGLSPTAIYYQLKGSTTFDGILIPTIELATESRVRVR